MAKKKVLTAEQFEQRRKASAAGAAKAHEPLCTCTGCFYRARKAVQEGGEQAFSTLVD